MGSIISTLAYFLRTSQGVYSKHTTCEYD